MSVGRKEHTLGLLQEAWDEGTLTGMEDRELLAQFAGRRDARAELAFAMLVRRHGPMVLGVCRRLLVDRHAADDAFQATFMVLARKASTLRRPDLLAGWLHSVALRTARCARVRDAGRGMATVSLAEAEESIPVRDRYDVPSRMIRREEAGLLHEEIGRLPEKYRLPLILCHFEGLTHEQAACRLRWPAGTLSVRLMRAKALLRTRLAGRGLAPGGLGDAMLLPALASRLALPPGLVEAAARAALAFVPPAGSAGSAPAVVLALAALRSLRVARWGAGLGLALAISVGVGAGPQGAKWGSPGDDLEIRAAALAAEITAGMPRSHRPQVPPIPPPGPSTVQEDVPEASPGFRWVQLPHFSTTPFLSSRPGALASSWQGESVAAGHANGEVYSDLVEVEEGEWLITPGHASSDLDPRLRDYPPGHLRRRSPSLLSPLDRRGAMYERVRRDGLDPPLPPRTWTPWPG